MAGVSANVFDFLANKLWHRRLPPAILCRTAPGNAHIFHATVSRPLGALAGGRKLVFRPPDKRRSDV